MHNAFRVAIGFGAAVVFYAASVSAGVAGGMLTFDPTNWIQNELSATNSIRTVANQVREYQAWLRQLAYDAKNMKDLSNYKTLGGIQDQLYRLQAFSGALGQLRGGLNNAGTDVMQQYRSYVSSDLTPRQYLQEQTQQNANTYGMAYGSYQQAKQELTQGIPRSWNRVRQLSRQIPKIQGINANMKLLNEQMNQLLRQNNELLKFVAINTEQKNPRIAARAKAAQKAALAKSEIRKADAIQGKELDSWENQWENAAKGAR
jgi:conjugal transfer/entry exclusion protein